MKEIVDNIIDTIIIISIIFIIAKILAFIVRIAVNNKIVLILGIFALIITMLKLINESK